MWLAGVITQEGVTLISGERTEAASDYMCK